MMKKLETTPETIAMFSNVSPLVELVDSLLFSIPVSLLSGERRKCGW